MFLSNFFSKIVSIDLFLSLISILLEPLTVWPSKNKPIVKLSVFAQSLALTEVGSKEIAKLAFWPK